MLIGQYAKAAMAGKPAKIATLDLAPGISVGVLRHNGFLSGLRRCAGDRGRPPRSSARRASSAAATPSGNQAKGQTAMENCLQKDADINLVYTINEPAALGAYTALKAAGQGEGRHDRLRRRRLRRARGRAVGQIAATSQQYPLKMATQGVEAVVEYAKTGDQGDRLHRHRGQPDHRKPQTGVESKDAAFGLENCWG